MRATWSGATVSAEPTDDPNVVFVTTAGTGRGTGLRKFTMVSPNPHLLTFEVEGQHIFTAANGDELVGEFSPSVPIHSSVLPFEQTVTDYIVTSASGTDYENAIEAPPSTEPLAGDYNGNNVVDAADYVVWRKTVGTPEGYDAWRANFGRTSTSVSTASARVAVPEPCALVLIATSFCIIGAARLPRRF